MRLVSTFCWNNHRCWLRIGVIGCCSSCCRRRIDNSRRRGRRQYDHWSGIEIGIGRRKIVRKLSCSCRQRRLQLLLKRCLHNKQRTAKLSERESERERERKQGRCVCDEKNSKRKRNPFILFVLTLTASHCPFLHALGLVDRSAAGLFTPQFSTPDPSQYIT